MHADCLNMPRLPSDALTQEYLQPVRCIFKCGRGDHFATIAEIGHTHAKIGIFGEIVAVPSAGFAQNIHPEMIGRATERDNAPAICQNRQKAGEQQAVFQREHGGQPFVLVIVYNQRSLKTGKIGRSIVKPCRRIAQLARVRLIFGILSHDKGPMRMGQSEITGAWFRFRPFGKNREQAHKSWP